MPKSKLTINKLDSINKIRNNLKKEFIGPSEIIDKIIDTYIISFGGVFEKDGPVISFESEVLTRQQLITYQGF